MNRIQGHKTRIFAHFYAIIRGHRQVVFSWYQLAVFQIIYID